MEILPHHHRGIINEFKLIRTSTIVKLTTVVVNIEFRFNGFKAITRLRAVANYYSKHLIKQVS